MTNLTRALDGILSGTRDCCCLCFKSNSGILIGCKDEASFTINNAKQNIVLSDLIITILGSDFTQYIEIMNDICEHCAKSLISIYTFIQTCKLNAEMFTNAIDSLNNCMENITKPEPAQSLFVSINLADLSRRVVYDNGTKIEDKKMAINRFRIISVPVKAPKLTLKLKNLQTSTKIKDSDMMLDPSNKNIFTCKECCKECISASNLRNHFIRTHTDNYKCTKCGLTFSSRALLKVHKAKSHKATCDECGKTYKNLHTLKMHRKQHNITLVCADCGRIYKNKVSFRNHVEMNICNQERRHSPCTGKYTCDHCGKKYTQKMSLRVHMQFEHGNYNSHVCEWCGKKFYAQSRLKAHIVKHTGEKNFACSICHGKFVTKESLLYHTRLHTGEKPYKCPECSSTFLSASRRSDHVKWYHGTEPGLECNVCHGKFRTGNILQKHKKTHEENVAKIQNAENDSVDRFFMKNISYLVN